MNKYIFLHQQCPTQATIPTFYQPGFFFNEYAHLQQQAGRFVLLSAVNPETRQAEARCALFIHSDEARSPAAAPFGSIEFSETLPDKVLAEFLGQLTTATRNEGAKKLHIVSYPHCYAQPQAERLTKALLINGFTQRSACSTYYISIGSQSLADQLVPAERRRLQQCQRAGFQANQRASADMAELIHFIEATRRQKGYPLSVTSTRLMGLCEQFPDQFIAFTVMDGPRLAAAAITVRVRHDILYNFLPASHPDYQTFSPMVMLTDRLFTYCRDQSIRLLDLGVSLDAYNQPKPSLMRFKRNLGAQESPKQTFEKLL